MSFPLRPYQLAAVDEIRTRYRAGKRRVLCIAPTGAGKTVLFAFIAQAAAARGSVVLVIAHRRELVKQASTKLTANGVDHGIIQDGFRPRPHCKVQVASIQTLQARPGLLDRVDLVVIDEAHHTTLKNGYAKVLAWFPDARVLGVTATPWRLDGKGLGDVFEDYVVAATPRELRDLGFLVPVCGWEYEAIDTSEVRISKGDFAVGELAEKALSAKVVGDVVAEWLQHAAGKRSVLFACSIEHSKKMVEAFTAAGVRAEHVDGAMNVYERDAVLERLRSGETLLVSNCNVLTEGFDCPELECVVLCRPTLSASLYLQMVGRGLRTAPGKASCRIHDHAGCLAEHGHPYAERDYSPEVSATKRKRAGPTIIFRCKACGAITDRWPCEACGHQPEPERTVEELPSAAKREITADGAGPRFVDDTATRAARWARGWANDETRQLACFHRWVAKHGLEKGCRVYRWFSGHTAQPRPEWIQRARELVERRGLAA